MQGLCTRIEEIEKILEKIVAKLETLEKLTPLQAQKEGCPPKSAAT